jgi:hypothetical protein
VSVLAAALIFCLPAAELAALPISDGAAETGNAPPQVVALIGVPRAEGSAGAFAGGNRPAIPAGPPASEDGHVPRPSDAQPRKMPAAVPADAAEGGATVSHRSLKNMLRSIATIRRTRPSTGEAPSRFPQSLSWDGSDYFDPFALIFESDIAGSALRALSEVKTTDGHFTTFSILGMGDFVLEVEGDAHSAILYELSSRWSAALIGARDGSGLLGYSADPTRAGESAAGVRPNVNLLQLAWNWFVEILTSPLGVLTTMIVGITAFMWVVYRAITLLQRRAPGARR